MPVAIGAMLAIVMRTQAHGVVLAGMAIPCDGNLGGCVCAKLVGGVHWDA